jgi:hypothetical protein
MIMTTVAMSTTGTTKRDTTNRPKSSRRLGINLATKPTIELDIDRPIDLDIDHEADHAVANTNLANSLEIECEIVIVVTSKSRVAIEGDLVVAIDTLLEIRMLEDAFISRSRKMILFISHIFSSLYQNQLLKYFYYKFKNFFSIFTTLYRFILKNSL